MNTVLSTQSGTAVQLGLFDAIKDLLVVNPIFLLGLLVICIMLVIIFKKSKTIPKIRTAILLVVFYYYLCVMLTRIVGILTLSECTRLSELGESFFNPNINIIPFSDGFSLGFIFNIFLFIPLGFLCPFISKSYQSTKNIFLIGCVLSLSIEINQLFTLWRATDIDDLIANTVGALVGYFCFKIINKLIARTRLINDFEEPPYMKYVPVVIIIITFILGFFSIIQM